MKRFLVATTGLLLAASLVGCGSGTDRAGSREVALTVYAASSLTEAFTELGQEFESQHVGVTVRFSFGGSSDLVEQIRQGAPADVFASADEKNMQKLIDAGDNGEFPQGFATNTLEIATPPGNPAGITSLADLAKKGVKLVVCAPEVPCGAAAQQVATAAGLEFEPVSEEQSVKDVLAKVASGEADAGLVYVTDVRAAGDAVTGIRFGESSAAVNQALITTVFDTEHQGAAEQFVDFVSGRDGQVVLASFGFGKP